MPVDFRRYPKGWKEFSAEIRFCRAHRQCECTGQCGLHQRYPTRRRCVEQHHTRARYMTGLVRLTVAHLCTCEPLCMNPAHVIAACQRCHLRIDAKLHARHRLASQNARREDPTRHMRPPGEPPWKGAGHSKALYRDPRFAPLRWHPRATL